MFALVLPFWANAQTGMDVWEMNGDQYLGGIYRTGFVGIGFGQNSNVVPGQNLHLYGATNAGVRFETASSVSEYWDVVNENLDMAFYFVSDNNNPSQPINPLAKQSRAGRE